MRISVIGTGAMGATFGGRLASAGCEVTFVDQWRERVRAINQDGLKITGIPGTLEIVASAILPEEVRPNSCDLAIICVDSNNTASAGECAKKMLRNDGFVVQIQNGIGNIETLMDILGRGSVVPASTMCSSTSISPAHIDQTHAGPTTIGEIDGSVSTRLETVKRLLESAGIETRISQDIVGVIWNKFVLNVSINALCAVTGLRLGEMIRQPELDELQDRVLSEALQIVAARGISLPDPDIRQTIKKHCWRKFSKPSMLQHMESGRRTEIDALNGAVVREGRSLKIATPYNEAVVALTKGCELAARHAALEPPIDYARLEAEAKLQEYPSSWTKGSQAG